MWVVLKRLHGCRQLGHHDKLIDEYCICQVWYFMCDWRWKCMLGINVLEYRFMRLIVNRILSDQGAGCP